jgi:acetyltransferase-like isoleucine patch superfamily enzyme
MSNSTPAERVGAAMNLLRRAASFIWVLEARVKGVQVRGRLILAGRPIISVAADSRLILEDGVSLFSAVRANPLACFQPCVLRTLAPGAEIELERNVGMSGTVVCAARSVRVGEGTIFGSGALVIDNDFHAPDGPHGWKNDYSQARPIRIGKGVFVGARAIILKGVSIGDRAVIGAGTVVTRDVPAGAVAAGNPARIVRSPNDLQAPSMGRD